MNERMHNQRRQQGAVLIVGLILLIAMTLIGVTAMKLTTLDERIAGNAQQRVGEFQAAESALMEVADYDKVLACSRAGEAVCGCAPDDLADAPRKASCLDKGLAKTPSYRFGLEQAGEDGGNVTIDAVAGMTYEGDIEIFGNSIGVDTAVAGRKVRITAVAGTEERRQAAPRHELLVAPIGLRNR